MPTPVSRRTVLQLVGAGAASAGASACSRGAPEVIVPYVDQPPEVTPSVPRRYATVTSLGGYGVGVLAESHEGRPTKLEGNPRHPASVGALSAIEQASLYDLYDPTRSRAPSHRGLPATWSAFAAAIAARPQEGKQTHVLLEPTSAPHLVELVRRVRAEGDVVVHFDSPVSRHAAWAGAKLAFGRVVEPRYDFSRAEVVVCLDADFLSASCSPHAWTRAWASRRRVNAPGDSMSRLYVVEPRLSVTGMAADERLRVQARQVERVAADLLAAVRSQRSGIDVPKREEPSPWVSAVVRDLCAHASTSLVLAGDNQPPAVHALAHALNESLGSVGTTVTYGLSPVFEAGEHGLEVLVQAIDAGQVATLVVMGGDPLYTAARDFDLARRFALVPTTAYVGVRDTMTGRACDWTCPETHWLEAWSDARAFDGAPAIAQPLLRPPAEGRTAAQVLAAMLGRSDASSRDLVQEYWRANTAGDFDAFWRSSLVHGVAATANEAPQEVGVDWTALSPILAVRPPPAASLEIVFFTDSKVYDGRFGDNAWLQELPDPITKLTWDNAALVGPATAARLGVTDERVVSLQVQGRALRAPVLVVPGMADDVVALALGYGQSVPQRASYGVGSNAYAIRHSRAPWFDEVVLEVTPDTHALSLTQEHGSMEGRPIVLRRTLDEYRRDPDFARPHNEPSRLALRPRSGSAAPVGNDHRSQRLHRLQCVRRGLHGGEQHSYRRQDRGSPGPGDALDAHRPLLLR